MEEGVLRLRVFVPTGTGMLLAYEHAQALSRTLQGVVLDGDIATHDIRIAESGPGDDDGAWWMLIMTIEWVRGAGAGEATAP